MNSQRRKLLRTSALTGAGFVLGAHAFGGNRPDTPPVACQQYTWFSFYQREGKEWKQDMKALKAAGLEGYEPSFSAVDQAPALQKKLTQQGVWTKSMYVNSTLHDEARLERSIIEALAIARAAKPMGVEIVVTNPSPIQWGQPIDKDDKQLRIQARALDRLGAELRKLGMRLAYHNHDMEMRQSAREFHHMMLGTDPENVHLCLDAHWVYRGAGNSQVALFDIVRLYADRIVELHLRQSRDGVWSEVFGEGDIDYGRLAEELLSRDLRPHLVLEQAAEEGTPQTMAAGEAIGKSLRMVQRVFSGR